MRVLVVSHNVFSSTESMGKTLMSYFSEYCVDDLAQLYFHSQVPTSNICKRYFRITDKSAIKSILTRKAGDIFEEKDIQSDRAYARTDVGLTASVYQKARKRTPMIYIARNVWWKLSAWNNRKFKKWLDGFDPECVFFASGDYSFSYRIALKIAQQRNIPLYISCMDDFYFYNKNAGTLLGRIHHKTFMRTVHKTMAYAEKIFCICEKMSEDYSLYFHRECITVHTPATIREPLHEIKKSKISYLGNLGFHRDEQLIAIGRTLKKLNLSVNHIDIYSSESRKEILKNLNEENGIVFHGAVEASDVVKIIGESLAVIHTESFDVKNRQAVRYSVSTKIADSLASGTCIFAYGPEEIASISYLKKQDAALCCTKPEELSKKLYQLITDSNIRDSICANAAILAQNHAISRTPAIIREVLKNETKIE